MNSKSNKTFTGHGIGKQEMNKNIGLKYGEENVFNANIEQQSAAQEKKTTYRRTVDHGNNMGRWYLEKKLGLTDQQQSIGEIRPDSSYLIYLMPPLAYATSFNLDRNNNKNNMAIVDIQTKFVHLSSNKVKHSINTVKWTPEGRRLVVASHSGEFTIWNGMTFNFETIMQAHDLPILALKYSHNGEWLLSGDQSGIIKYWQSNFNNVNILSGHSNGVRDIAFSPNDSKFLTCGDDSTVKIWNFNDSKEERTLVGHHWEVKSADWHPFMGLVVSGSKDNLIKLWDPRVSACVTTLHGFKHTITKTRFQPTGTMTLLASVSRDRSCKILDLRMMKDVFHIKDSESDLSCVSWHPLHSMSLTTSTYNGSINYYLLNSSISINRPNEFGTERSENKANLNTVENVKSAHKIPFAHEKAIYTLEYHPLGHLLCSAGSDKTARFWSRARPNDPLSFKDALYTDEKHGAWFYSINNNINAVVNPASTDSIPSSIKTETSSANYNFNDPYINDFNSLDKDRQNTINLPGLMNTIFDTETNGLSKSIPGLKNHRD